MEEKEIELIVKELKTDGRYSPVCIAAVKEELPGMTMEEWFCFRELLLIKPSYRKKTEDISFIRKCINIPDVRFFLAKAMNFEDAGKRERLLDFYKSNEDKEAFTDFVAKTVGGTDSEIPKEEYFTEEPFPEQEQKAPPDIPDEPKISEYIKALCRKYFYEHQKEIEQLKSAVIEAYQKLLSTYEGQRELYFKMSADYDRLKESAAQRNDTGEKMRLKENTKEHEIKLTESGMPKNISKDALKEKAVSHKAEGNMPALSYKVPMPGRPDVLIETGKFRDRIKHEQKRRGAELFFRLFKKKQDSLAELFFRSRLSAEQLAILNDGIVKGLPEESLRTLLKTKPEAERMRQLVKIALNLNNQ